MIRFRIALAALSVIATSAAIVVTMTVTPLAVAADSTALEAESMTIAPAIAGGKIWDRVASGSWAIELRRGATASTSVTVPASSSVVIRAKGTACNNVGPTFDVTVDAKKIGTVTVPPSGSTWADYTVTASIASGKHAIGLVFTNPYWNVFCTRKLQIDRLSILAATTTTTTTTPTTTTTTPTTTTTTPTTTTTTPTTTTTTAPTTTPPPNPAARLFNGDYSTGNFRQWPVVQTKNYNSSGTNYVPTYSASIVQDPAKGNVARFEVRSGDVPPFGGGERAEVQAGDETGGTEGQTRWYAFSTKFDPTFPQNHADLGWGLTNQWHANASGGSPPVGWYLDAKNGHWSLVINRQSAPGTYLNSFSIIDVPLKVGTWHDVKMQVTWSRSDTAGAIKLWLNGVPQTFTNGSTTYNVRTLIPGATSVYYKEGIYREAMAPTAIVYHAGFRAASAESGL
jgi:hypothetical protein